MLSQSQCSVYMPTHLSLSIYLSIHPSTYLFQYIVHAVLDWSLSFQAQTSGIWAISADRIDCHSSSYLHHVRSSLTVPPVQDRKVSQTVHRKVSWLCPLLCLPRCCSFCSFPSRVHTELKAAPMVPPCRMHHDPSCTVPETKVPPLHICTRYHLHHLASKRTSAPPLRPWMSLDVLLAFSSIFFLTPIGIRGSVLEALRHVMCLVVRHWVCTFGTVHALHSFIHMFTAVYILL